MSSRRSCGKVRYRNSHTAQRALNTLRRSDREHPVRAYPCPRCHGWHLTKGIA